MDGVLNVLKPPGMTSHDVVAVVRRLLRQKRVGHTGTLDPGAAGVLPVCVGQATRLAEYLSELGKVYRAEVVFGVATDTQDGFGSVTERRPCPGLTAAAVRDVLPRFTGPVRQVPPMVSAVKVGGRRLYELAREGREVERAARTVTIHRLALLHFQPGPEPVARLEVACSKGTYVRVLAADIGAALGVPAHLAHLVRTAAGPFDLTGSVTLEELAAGPVEQYLLPAAAAVAFLPQVVLDAAAAAGVRHGRVPRLPGDRLPAAGPVALLGPGGELLATARVDAGPPVRLKLEKVLVH